MFPVAFISTLLISTVLSVPIRSNVSSRNENYALALDINAATDSQTFLCLSNAGYQTAFVRIYTNRGTFDRNGPSNLLNAHSARMNLEAYIEPQLSNSKPGSKQLDEAINYVTSQGVYMRSVWLQVTDPTSWSNNVTANVQHINSFITRAQQINVGCGIYTSVEDWQQITNGYSGFPDGIPLWYSHVAGPGQNGATAANFNDFVPFGKWQQPFVKQYAQQISDICSVTINSDTHLVSKSDKDASMKKINPIEDEKVPVVG